MANPYQAPWAPDPNFAAGELGERGTSQFPSSNTHGFKLVHGVTVAVDGSTNLPGPTPSKYSPGSTSLGNAGYSAGSPLYVPAE